MSLQGAKSHWAKLTPEEVRMIRREYDMGVGNGSSIYAVIKRLAAEYGVAPNTIYYVGTRHTWQSLEEDDAETTA